jgi:hypothetical protein
MGLKRAYAAAHNSYPSVLSPFLAPASAGAFFVREPPCENLGFWDGQLERRWMSERRPIPPTQYVPIQGWPRKSWLVGVKKFQNWRGSVPKILMPCEFDAENSGGG